MTEAHSKSWLSGLVLLCFCVISGVVSTWAFITNVRDQAYALDRERVWGGEAAQEIGQSFSKTDLSTWMAQRGREISWLALKDLGPQVRQGCPGWLFLTDELQIHRDAAVHAAERAAIVQQLSERLAARGVKVLLAVVPDKSRMARSKLCELNRPVSLDDRVDGWLSLLRTHGVSASMSLVPALDALGDQGYLRTDTHWSELGARSSANAVATQLHQQGYRVDSPQDFLVTEGAPLPRPGDLVRLAGVNGLPAAWQPEGEIVVASSIAVKDAGGGDLFDDASLPTLAIVGTSYSRTSNFVPWLEVALKSQAGQFAKDGAEFAGSILVYLQSSAFKQTPPQFLLWEIPERYIQTPLSDRDRALRALASEL